MELPKVNREDCIGCEICIDICPVKIITLKNGKAIIANESCKNCRACEMVCPTGAIE